MCLAGSNISDIHHTRADMQTIIHLDSNHVIHVQFYVGTQVKIKHNLHLCCITVPEYMTEDHA